MYVAEICQHFENDKKLNCSHFSQ